MLNGCKELLKNKYIGVIQFEFNEMNVVSRVFFKDFFDLLSPGYKIYRLHKESLKPIESYDTKHEIFKFQNIVAINKLI